MKYVAVSLFVLVLAFFAGRFAEYAIVSELVPVSVGDPHGHGPDYGGREWRYGLNGYAKLVSRNVTISVLTIGAIAFAWNQARRTSRIPPLLTPHISQRPESN